MFQRAIALRQPPAGNEHKSKDLVDTLGVVSIDTWCRMFDTNVALVEHVLNESSAPAPYQSLTPVALNNLDSSAGRLRRRVFVSQALSWIALSIQHTQDNCGVQGDHHEKLRSHDTHHR